MVSYWFPERLCDIHTPGICKVNHEDPDKDNRHPTSCPVFLKCVLIGSDNTRNDEVANCHT